MDKELTILLISFFGKGGAAQHTGQLANALSKDHSVAAIIPEYADVPFDEQVYVIKVPVPLGYFETILKTIDLTFFMALIRKIDHVHPDVIHITSKHPWSPLLLLFLGQKYPVVTTIHDPEPHTGVRTKFVLRLSNRMLIAFSNKIIVLGKKLKEDLIKKGVPEEKINVTPHGGFSMFLKWEKGDIGEVKGTVLFFGIIEPYKGLEYLIEAAEIIKNELCDFKIIVAGEGDISKYKKLIEIKNLSDNFVLINEYIPNDKVAELFQKASLVVLPYIEGTQSGVPHLAYVFKRAVVATDVGSIPEIVENGVTGYVVPPRNVNALTDAIVKLLEDDKLRKKMGERGYKKMAGELSWDKIAEMTRKVYDEAILTHVKKN